MSQGSSQITGYGARQTSPHTPPPFSANNVVILTNGTCGSTCTIAVEILLNAHSVSSIVVGGRPSTGPMQTIGSTKGSMVFSWPLLRDEFLSFWQRSTSKVSNLSQVDMTPFQHLEAFGLVHEVKAVNGRNNHRIGDNTETPLQMVYSAADCGIWPTLDILTDQSRVWSRVAEIAFDSTRKAFGAEGGPYTSKLCMKGSTGHSTSVTGGLKHGQLGSQKPPRNAYPQYTGWLKDGKEIVQGLSLVRIDNGGSGSIQY